MQAAPSAAVRELASFDRRQGFLQACVYMLITFLILGIHVVVTAGCGPVGLVWLVSITLACLYLNRQLALTLLIVTLIMQNAFVSLASPLLNDFSEYKLLLGTSFLNILLTSLICVPAWVTFRDKLPKENRVLLRWMGFFFVIVAAYSGLGFLSAPFSDVLLYIRVYLTGGLLLAIGLAFGFQIPRHYIFNVVRVLAVILVAWGILEFFFSYEMYMFFHVVDFFRFKYSTSTSETDMFNSINDVIEFSSRSYLNLSGVAGINFELLRPNGPNLHPISYGYSLAFCCLMCFICRSYFLSFACALLVLLVGAKGPLIMVFMCLPLYWFYSKTHNTRWLLTATGAFMAVYVAGGLAYGISTNDFHAIGFLGGLRGFLNNPLGHGIGVGGTLSQTGLGESLKDMEFFQGFGADYGFESAMGVLIYQVGVSISVFLMFYYQLWKSTWRAALHFVQEPRQLIIPTALAFLLVNGIFQEEALSPVGWGLWLLVGGLMIAQYWREKDLAPLIPETRSSASSGA